MEDSKFGIYKREVSGKTIYYVYYYDEYGKRVHRTTGQKTKTAAKSWVLDQMEKGTLFGKNAKDITFSEFAQPFWIYETCPIVQSKILRGGTMSKGYCLTSRRILEDKLIPAFGKKKLKCISPDDVDRWILALPAKDNISANTVNKAYMILSQMLDVAVKKRYIDRNPCKEVKRLIEKTNSRGCFTNEQIKDIFSYPWDNKMAYTTCLLSATTGMRMGEIRGLTIDKVYIDYIEVSQAWGEHDGLKGTKSGKSRIVPITKQVHDLLFDIAPRKEGFIFTFNGEKPIDFQFVTLRLQKVMNSSH